MARPISQATPIQNAAKAAREANTKARELHDKNPSAANKKAMDDAKAKMQAAVKAENRERFIKIGQPRVKTVRASLDRLAKIASPRMYEFGEADVAKIKAGIKEKYDACMIAFDNALKGQTATAVSDDFSLE